MPSRNVGNNSGVYFLHDLLMRWIPHGENLAGGLVEQIVLPVKYRQSVIKMVHGNVAALFLGSQRRWLHFLSLSSP